jgi:ABC-type multidrug transport system ATPase subunit
MEEADTLSDRIGILIQGNLKCLGTPQRLKSVYGSGYTITFKCTSSNSAQNVSDYIPRAFLSKNTKIDYTIQRLIGRNCQVKISMSDSRRDSVEFMELTFRIMNEMRKYGLMEFSVTQTSLQQVFIDFAKSQKEIFI